MTETIRIYGYHGTSAEAAAAILQDGFNISSNEYDWLGKGVYFWQDAPLRAWTWANQNYHDNPAVIRSSIRLENCMDLLDIKWFPFIRRVYNSFVAEYESTNQTLPQQNPERSKAHRLDCAFFDYTVEKVLQPEGQIVKAIRSVFVEGDRIFPNSAVFDLAHVQIAIRDTALIEESCLIEISGGI